MTEHLPECADKNSMPQYLDCFCDVVRSCEKRMNDKWEKFSRDQFDAGHSDGYKKAVADAQWLLEEHLDSTGWVALTKMTPSDG